MKLFGHEIDPATMADILIGYTAVLLLARAIFEGITK